MYIKTGRLKIVAGLILSLIVILSLLLYFNKKKTVLKIDHDYITLTYYYDGKSNTVRGQMIQADDSFHIFAPPFYKLDNIIIDSKDNYTITKGYYYKDSFSKEIVNENQVSPAILISNNKDSNIIIHQLENDILSIDLKDGYTLDDIKADKELKVKANIQNIDKYGKTLFNGKLDHIKGRGNSSWIKDKKGWSLAFNNNVDLMDLGLNEKYVLIPFMDDMTGIRCKLVFDYAKKIGLEKTNSVEYVNVFINERYQGLYLITPHISNNELHKKNTQDKELIIENNIGELQEIKYFDNQKKSSTLNYIIEKDLIDYYRNTSDCAGFITKRGDAYTIHNSNSMTRDEILQIALLFQGVENSVNEDNNTDYMRIIDIDSWIKRYLIEEIFQNTDVCTTSTFYYIKEEEPNRLYAGPPWDYDFTMGMGILRGQDPKVLNLINSVDHLNSKLGIRKEFMDEVIREYRFNLYPKIKELIYLDTEQLSKRVKNDMYLNALIYNQQYKIVSFNTINEYNYNRAVDMLKDQLYKHTEYMNEIYQKYYEQRRVNLITNNTYISNVLFLVENGHSFIQDHEVPYYSSGNGFVWNKPLWVSKWVDKDGKEFDFTKPITEDTELYAVWEGENPDEFIQK